MGYPVAECVRAGAVTLAAPCLLLLEEVLSFFVEPIFVERGLNIELDSVIASRDCFNIPFHVVKLLVLPDVVEIVKAEKCHENSQAGVDQALELPVRYLVFSQCAANLDKDRGLFAEALISGGCRFLA